MDGRTLGRRDVAPEVSAAGLGRTGREHRGGLAAGVAAILAFVSAACTAFWLAGGTAGLDTVGGAIERLADERSAGTLAALAATLVLKLLAGVLALWLAARGRSAPRWAVRLGLVGGIGLTLYGGLLVAAGALSLAGAIGSSGPRDEYALRWHVLFWDPWFLLWGVALALAASPWRRRAEAGG